MENGVQNILGKFTLEDIEKLKVLLSIVPAVIQKEVITLRIFADEYSNLIKENRSEAYYKSVTNSLKHLTYFFGAQRPLNSIELKDIESFISNLQKKVPKGFRVYVRTLKAAYSKALDWNYIKENYFMRIKLPKKQHTNPAFVTSKQLAIIGGQIDNSVIRDLVIFAFYTGMRLNEIVNLTWRNVNLNTRIITVGDDEFTTKGRNQRYIPICEEAYEALLRMDNVQWLMLNGRKEKKEVRCETRNEKSETREGKSNPSTSSGKAERREKIEARGEKNTEKKNTPRILQIHPSHRGECKSKYVFCKENGERFTGDYVSKIFKKACKAAGIDKSIHFHSLRHSFASNLVQKGVNLYTIKELLGHSSIATTEIYSHLNMDSLKEAIRTFDRPHLNPLLSKERTL